MDRGTSEDEMEADTDLDGGGSRFGAFLRGVLLGAVVSAAAAVAVSLTSPLPADQPLAGRVEIVGQPPAAEGEASAEAPSDATGEAVPEAGTPDPSEPGIVPVVPLGGEAVVPETAEDAPPETDTPETASPDAAPAGPVPSADSPADTPPGEDDAPAAQPGGAEPSAVAPDAATAPPGDSTEPAAVPDSEAAPDASPGASAQPGQAGSALAANARAFDAPRRAPLLAVVLTGDEVADLSADRLALLTMPLTVAIPPETTRAAELGADARAAGHEVLADLSLAAEASAGGPGEPQAAVQRIASLDMAVGATATGGTTDADLLAPVLAELGRHGFAWVDTDAAISTPAERIARELGVPYTQGNKTINGDQPGPGFPRDRQRGAPGAAMGNVRAVPRRLRTGAAGAASLGPRAAQRQRDLVRADLGGHRAARGAVSPTPATNADAVPGARVGSEATCRCRPGSC